MSKILYILDEFSPISETFVYNQIIELSKSQEVFVICKKRINNKNFPFTNFQVLVPSSNNLRECLLKRNIFLLLKNKKTRKQIIEVRKSFKPTSIVIHFGPCFLKNIYNIGSLNIPVFVFFHGYDVSSMIKKSKTYSWRMKKALKLTNVYPVCISLSIQEKLKNAFSTRNQYVQYLGIDTNYFTPCEMQNIYLSKNFIQVSRLTDKKGIEYTLAAFAIFKKENPDHNFSFTIVGEGPLKRTLELKTRNLNLEKEVSLVGKKSQKEIKNLLSSSDVFIQNSITARNGDSEGLPISIMEAMSMDLPIIASNHSGIPELVGDKNGILTEEKNLESIKRAIKKIYSFQKVNNRKKIIENFSLDKNVEAFYLLIKSKENKTFLTS